MELRLKSRKMWGGPCVLKTGFNAIPIQFHIQDLSEQDESMSHSGFTLNSDGKLEREQDRRARAS